VGSLVTGRYPLTETAAALTASGLPGHLKVVIDVSSAAAELPAGS
jgi:hypothetical protein